MFVDAKIKSHINFLFLNLRDTPKSLYYLECLRLHPLFFFFFIWFEGISPLYLISCIKLKVPPSVTE